MIRTLEVLHQNLEFTEFAPREFIARRATVVAIGGSTARSKKTGKTTTDDWIRVA
jgi:uncharacterized protein